MDGNRYGMGMGTGRRAPLAAKAPVKRSAWRARDGVPRAETASEQADSNAGADFRALVRRAVEEARRREAVPASTHSGVDREGRRWQVACVDVPDAKEPHALLTARVRDGSVVHRRRLPLGARLPAAQAERFAISGGA